MDQSPERQPLVTARRRGWPVLVAAVLLGAVLLAGAVVAYGVLRPATYTADSLVLVESAESPSNAVPIAAVWAEVATSDAVVAPVAEDLGLGNGRLRDAVTVSASQQAPLITVTAVTPQAGTSAEWANAVAAAMVARSSETPVAGFTLRPVTAAVPPQEADTGYGVQMVVGATVIGALLGLLTARWLLRRRRG